MTLPTQVVARGARADELIQQLGKPEAVAAAVAAPPTDAPAAPPSETAPDAQAAPAPASSAPVDPAQAYQVLEQRFRVLQGKYNAEVPALHRKVQSLETENARLQELAAAPPEPQAGEPRVSEAIATLEETFGPELSGPLQQLLSQLSARVERVESRTQAAPSAPAGPDPRHAALATAIRTLDPAVDFETVETDPDFITWLQDYPEYSARTKHELLLEAYGRGDYPRAARFYVDYAQSRRANPVDLSAHTRPDLNPARPPQDVAKPIWTRERVQQLYRDNAAGRLSEAQFKALEQELFEAQKQGQLR